jgi:hypothetical protein
MRMPKMRKITIKVVERRARPFSVAHLRDMGGYALACVICQKSDVPFTVSLSMKVRNKPSSMGFACQECGKLSDRELVQNVIRQINEQRGGAYEAMDVSPEGYAGVPLDAFLREVSAAAEHTFEMNKGGINPGWIVVTRAGKAIAVGTPFDDDAGKQRAIDHMRRFMVDNHAVRYAFIAEAWEGGADNPNRKSIVTIYVQDRDGGAMDGRREIIGDGGPNPTLGPLESEIVPPEHNTGRFMNLLEPLPEPLAITIKQHRLNGKPCCKPELIPAQGDKLEDFPDELMCIQQIPDSPDDDLVVIVPCRIKDRNRIEVSEATWQAGIRTFSIYRDNRERRIVESSAPDRCHWPIPDTVLALVGQRIPNTENETVVLSSEQVKLANAVGPARWAKKQRMRAMN